MNISGIDSFEQNASTKWSNSTLSWAHLPLFGTLLWPWPRWPLTFNLVRIASTHGRCSNTLFFFPSELFPSYFWPNDRKMDRQKAVYKSPLCISTGGLKKLTQTVFWLCTSIILGNKKLFGTSQQALNIFILTYPIT